MSVTKILARDGWIAISTSTLTTSMKVNRYGRAAILSTPQITLLFNEGFTKPRDRALFGVCLYGAACINEACTMLRGDVIGIKGVRDILVIRSYNTKGRQETREIQVHGGKLSN